MSTKWRAATDNELQLLWKVVELEPGETESVALLHPTGGWNPYHPISVALSDRELECLSEHDRDSLVFYDSVGTREIRVKTDGSVLIAA